ncbi:MAG TPA: hypothetical protein VED01_03375 [Burkholderiales bacterium]|nr:hypothetical protein [Burkholderiales bacterium]
MATIKELVDARLAELGLTKTDFVKKLGYSTYQAYYDLFSSQRTRLTDEKLEQIAEALQWPKDHFRDPAKTLERETYIRQEFEKYLRSEIGRTADPETHRILKSMQWLGKYLPNAKLYQILTLTMEGRYTAAQLLDALELEAADNEALEKERMRKSAGPHKKSR